MKGEASWGSGETNVAFGASLLAARWSFRTTTNPGWLFQYTKASANAHKNRRAATVAAVVRKANDELLAPAVFCSCNH